MRKVGSLILILMLSACSTEPLVISHPVESQKTGENRVYVANHGWHTGFIIPAASIRQSVPELKRRFGGAEFIEIGWGDRGFYQAQEITVGLTMRAVFWPSESVIHAVAVPTDPVAFFPNSAIEELGLDDGELSRLVQFISDSLGRDGGGNIVPMGNGLYGDSQFYVGAGHYHLMNTCNKWTAKGLKSAGMDISPAFKLTAGSVMDAVRDHPPRAYAPNPAKTRRSISRRSFP